MTVADADGPTLLVRARRSPVSGVWLVLEDVSELRRLQQIRAEFIDNLSHELRTPLTTVSLLAETLTRDADAAGDAVPARMRDRIGKIEVETGPPRPDGQRAPRPVPDRERRRRSVLVDRRPRAGSRPDPTERLRLFAERQGVTPARRRRPRPCRRSAATRQRLGQVLVNLLHNAVKFSPDGGDVTVSVRRRRRPRSSAAVEDHGVGIPQAAQARIFERFYKVDRARVRGEAGGTGLGLAIARHVVEQHGGRIWVESSEGVGSTFSFAPARSPDRDRVDPSSEGPMDRLHVATLNIRNLADRWAERLPLILADMAALQPDLLGLQEVVYVDAAGPAHRGGGRGPLRRRPRLGGSAGVRQQPAGPGAARRRPTIDGSISASGGPRTGPSSRCPAARRSSWS